jgi:hypothetical protein
MDTTLLPSLLLLNYGRLTVKSISMTYVIMSSLLYTMPYSVFTHTGYPQEPSNPYKELGIGT